MGVLDSLLGNLDRHLHPIVNSWELHKKCLSPGAGAFAFTFFFTVLAYRPNQSWFELILVLSFFIIGISALTFIILIALILYAVPAMMPHPEAYADQEVLLASYRRALEYAVNTPLAASALAMTLWVVGTWIVWLIQKNRVVIVNTLRNTASHIYREHVMKNRTQQQLAFAFGTVFVIAMLVLAVAFPHPTAFQFTVFRVVLALAAAGVAAMVPGFLEVAISTWLRAGGALGVFVVIYFFNPASLIALEDFGDGRLEITNVGFTRDSEFDVQLRNLSGNDLIIHNITITKVKDHNVGVAPELKPTARYKLPVDEIAEGASKTITVSHVVPAHGSDRLLIALSTTKVYTLKVTFTYNKDQTATFERSTWMDSPPTPSDFPPPKPFDVPEVPGAAPEVPAK